MAIELIDTLAPKNGGEFPMVMGEDVEVNGMRLPEALQQAGGEPEQATDEDIDAIFAQQDTD